MPVTNSDIAAIFTTIADLLEIKGANRFRIRAYREAASTIGGLSKNISSFTEDEDITDLPGIGEDLAAKVREIIDTGTLEQLEELKKEVHPEITELLKISGLGAERVRALHEKLNITSLEDLEEAAKNEKIRTIEGFGAKTEKKILEDIERAKSLQERLLLSEARQIATPLVDYLKNYERVGKVTVAGSYRRWNATVGDLDIVVVHEKGKEFIDYFGKYENIDKVVSKGKTRSTILLKSGLQVDLRVVPEKSYGAALLYFTGSRPHTLSLRKIAMDKGYKLNEYGLFKGEKVMAGKTEKAIYTRLGLNYIEPELRENKGEIEASREDRLPSLVSWDDLQGDLHAHTNATDGHHTVEELAKAAKERGYQYIAITDHSKNVTVVNGLDVKRLSKQIDEIEKIHDRIKGIRILKGIEVDILEDGSLDLPDDILKRLDIRICAVHSNFTLSREKQTERIIRAMDNPYFNILAHPTGRRISEREPYDIDLERIMDAARERGCFLEINSQPNRLDLRDVHCRMAKERGVMVAINTDTHRINDLDYIRFGVAQARRGWLAPGDVINTRKWIHLKKLLNR